MSKYEILETADKKLELGMKEQRQASTRVHDLSLLACMKKAGHKKVFINSETFTVVRGEIPK